MSQFLQFFLFLFSEDNNYLATYNKQKYSNLLIFFNVMAGLIYFPTLGFLPWREKNKYKFKSFTNSKAKESHHEFEW